MPWTQLAGTFVDAADRQMAAALARGEYELAALVDVERARRRLGLGVSGLFQRGAVFVELHDGQAVVPTVGHVKKPAGGMHFDLRAGILAAEARGQRRDGAARRQRAAILVHYVRRDAAPLFVID